MLTKSLFRRPQNTLEGNIKAEKTNTKDTAEELGIMCPRCKKMLQSKDLSENLNVCPYCSQHYRMGVRQRINIICDQDSFTEIDKDLISKNILDFPNYDIKLNNSRLESEENDAVVCGTCTIEGNEAAIFIMEPSFMMGSMGSVVGEKITRLFELALKKSLPVVGYIVSGGARMQEGIISLMQMAKTSGAVKKHSDKGNLFVAVLTDPTTGGVTASFAMEADIIIAEPNALIGFAGPRVIEQTIREKLPEGFQRAEFLMEKGFLDAIVDRKRQKTYLGHILSLHRGECK